MAPESDEQVDDPPPETGASDTSGGRDSDPDRHDGDGWGVDAAFGAAALAARAATDIADTVGSSVAGRAIGGTARWLTRPLAREGEEVRERLEHGAGPAAQQVIRRVTPGVVDAVDINDVLAAIDVDALLDRIDVNRLVDRIDVAGIVAKIDVAELVNQVDVQAIVNQIDLDDLLASVDLDALLARIDVDALVSRIDLDALLASVDLDRLLSNLDLDALLGSLDLDAVLATIDLNELLGRLDMDALVSNTELGSIIAQSTSGVASNVLDGVRSQGVGIDGFIARLANRMLLRDPKELPAGPPLLTDDQLALPAPTTTTPTA